MATTGQAGRCTGERGGRQDGPEAAVDLGQLVSQRVAAGALLKVVVDGSRRRRLAGWSARPESFRVRAARRRDIAADVLLQVGLPEALAGPDSQGRHPVGGQPEHRRDRGGRLALNLQLPQHGPPARRR